MSAFIQLFIVVNYRLIFHLYYQLNCAANYEHVTTPPKQIYRAFAKLIKIDINIAGHFIHFLELKLRIWQHCSKVRSTINFFKTLYFNIFIEIFFHALSMQLSKTL